MKKAIILGTYNPQLDAIHYLKSQGWWVIGCGLTKVGKAIEFLDQFELINLKDIQGLEDLARKEQVDLFYSVAGEIALFPLSIIPPKLGMRPILTPEQYEIHLNKLKLREFLNTHDISPVMFRRVSSAVDLEGWDCFPAMVKPADSGGQRGVYKAESMDEILAGLDRSLSYSLSNSVIVEEYLDGPEVSANAFVVNGEVVFVQFSDRLVLEDYPGGIPRGHVVPSQWCTGENLCMGEEIVRRSAKALKVENGPLYYQMKVTSKGPRIIEIMFRMDGCQIWRLIRNYCGVDLVAASLRSAMGEDLTLADFQSKPDGHIYETYFFLSPPGKTFHTADFLPPPDAIYCEYRYSENEVIRAVNGYMEVIGNYIIRK